MTGAARAGAATRASTGASTGAAGGADASAAAGGPARLGDLVVCASKAWREQAGLAREVGIFLLARRRDALVHFPGSDRQAWIPRDTLKAIDADDPRVAAPPAWLVRVHRAVRLLEATDLELERGETGAITARIGCPGLDPPQLRALAALAAGDAEALRILPGSMSRVLVVLPARAADGGAPAATPAGT